MDLNLIKTFVEVARIENLNLAAQKLYVTPSALSQRIKALEDRVGRSLFVRKRTGMELTKAGHELMEICFSLNSDMEKISNWMMYQKGYVGGHISIAICPGMSNFLFPDFMKEFLEKHHQITFAVNNALSVDSEDAVAEGKADVGIIVGKCQRPSLKMQRILTNNNVLMVCSPDYFLSKKKNITRKDLNEATILWHGDKRSRTLKEICKDLGIPFHSEVVKVILPDMDACKQHALKGIGIAFVAKMYIQEELKRGDLVALPGLNLKRPAYMISRNEKYEAPAINAFKDEFVSYCAEFDKGLVNKH